MNIYILSERKNQYMKLHIYETFRVCEVSDVILIKQLSYVIVKYKVPDDPTHIMKYIAFRKTVELVVLLHRVRIESKGYSRSVTDRRSQGRIALTPNGIPYQRVYKNNKDIYLLKHPAECVYYVLREEIQIVAIHILDNRVDEIEYR